MQVFITNLFMQALEDEFTNASENITKSKAFIQKLAFYREDVLDKKKTVIHANMILEVYEQREREFNNYFDSISKQFDRTSQFYKDVDKFEAWYPKIEKRLQVEEELSDDAGNLKRTLAEFEVGIV